jgi:hypothetical protein
MTKAAFIAALAALTSCTGDVCSQTQGVFEESTQVEQTCIDAELRDAGLGTLPPGEIPTCDLDLNACEQRIKSCTPADLAVLQAQINCENEELAQLSASCNDADVTATCPDAGPLSETCAIELGDVSVNCDGGF